MKNCPNCNMSLDDSVMFCTGCGYSFSAQQTGYNPNQQQYSQNQQQYGQQGGQYYAPGQPYVDPTDHTAEFDPKDISDNKVIAMLPYLASYIGIIVALIGATQSKYAAFHVRQALKLTVVGTLIGIISALLCWTIIVPFAGVVCSIIILVLKIIAFFQVCGGKAKEPSIISGFNFLK